METFNSLTPLQQKNINRELLDIAVKCVNTAEDQKELDYIIHKKCKEDCTINKADLIRYCRLVKSVNW